MTLQLLKETPLALALLQLVQSLEEAKGGFSKVDIAAETASFLAEHLNYRGDKREALRRSTRWLSDFLLALAEHQNQVLLQNHGIGKDEIRKLKEVYRRLKISAQTKLNGNYLGLHQFMYDESEQYAHLLSKSEFGNILEYLPDAIQLPRLLHNLGDILIEGQGHHEVFATIRPELIRTLRRAEAGISGGPAMESLLIYEILGSIGLCADNVEFYEKYLLRLRDFNVQLGSSLWRNRYSWWGDSYYGDRATALQEHTKNIHNVSYGLVRSHMALLLAGLSESPINKIVEEAGLEEQYRTLYTNRWRSTSMSHLATEVNRVFIIHGHNEARWRELEKMVKEEFELRPVVLGEQPDRGASTIIEKFEYYASKCCYALAIFTPDDQIEKNGDIYLQARPNVIFEIGWFAGKLGREKIQVLLQEGTELFSDLDGVIQKRFIHSVAECYTTIRDDLLAAGLLQ